MLVVVVVLVLLLLLLVLVLLLLLLLLLVLVVLVVHPGGPVAHLDGRGCPRGPGSVDGQHLQSAAGQWQDLADWTAVPSPTRRRRRPSAAVRSAAVPLAAVQTAAVLPAAPLSAPFATSDGRRSA